MTLPRSLMTPTVWQPEDPSTVCYRTPTESPNTYYETVLTPDEAEMFSFWLLVDAKRAKAYISTQKSVRVVKKI